MPVHVIQYAHQGRDQWGVVRDETITPIMGDFPTTATLIEYASNNDLSALHGDQVDQSKVKVLSPVTRNQQLICLGANYRSHMVESGVDPDAKKFNMVFRKASSCIVPADSDVVRPDHVALLDYEVELGLVLRRDITAPLTVTDDNLHELVAGVTIVNDYSARDVQLPQMQFYKGKSYRTFGPAGPYLTLVDAGDLARFAELRLHLTVNGETRQNSLASDMVHKPAPTLTELSALQNWQAGDLLATGTPGGCALQAPAAPLRMLAQVLPALPRQKLIRNAARGNTRKLKPGDVIETRIRTDDGKIDLGVQRNQVVRAS